LKTKFSWVNEEEYVANRKKRLSLSKKNKRDIDITIDFLRQYKIENALGISEVDILCLAHGHVLNIPVITDDADMLQVAKDFSIQTMKTLELMSLMLDCNYINLEKIRQIVAYWEYISDKPGGFRNDYIRIFGEKPPQ
jgi:predicted nucleic acid-binding protein